MYPFQQYTGVANQNTDVLLVEDETEDEFARAIAESKRYYVEYELPRLSQQTGKEKQKVETAVSGSSRDGTHRTETPKHEMAGPSKGFDGSGDRDHQSTESNQTVDNEFSNCYEEYDFPQWSQLPEEEPHQTAVSGGTGDKRHQMEGPEHLFTDETAGPSRATGGSKHGGHQLAGPSKNVDRTFRTPYELMPPPPAPVSKFVGLDASGFDRSSGHTWIYPTNLPIRDYQFNIVCKALYENTLVCLPTGLGKTFIAAVVMYNFYRWYPQGKVLFMAPTKPLVNQQIESCYKVMGIPKEDTAEMTGAMPPQDREVAWRKCRLFFLTPHVVSNDLARGVCPSDHVRCLVIDEAHRAKGNYAYCKVIQNLLMVNKNFRVLALSATPGGDMDAVNQVLQNLLISNLELRSEKSLDTAQYMHERVVDKIVVKLEGYHKKCLERFRMIIDKHIRGLVNAGAVYGSVSNLTTYGLIMQREKFRANQKLPAKDAHNMETDFAVCMSLYRGLESLKHYGLRSFLRWLEGTMEDCQSGNFIRHSLSRDYELQDMLNELKQKLGGVEFKEPEPDDSICVVDNDPSYVVSHPKLERLREEVVSHFKTFQQRGEESRVMIFCTYRDTVIEICHELSKHRPLVKPMTFVGQSSLKLKGFSQKQQLLVMKKFRSGGYNTLISTCVGEEGLDIGEVDLIVCYDAQNSPIRMVQRMGRTGRKRQGRIVMLLLEGKEYNKYKKSISSHSLISKNLLDSRALRYVPNSPRMVPDDLNPVCHRLFMTVQPVTAPKPKGGSRNQDLRKMLGRKKSKSSVEENIADAIDDLDSFVPEFDKLPKSQFLHTLSKDELRKVLSDTTEDDHEGQMVRFDRYLEWQRDNEDTINVSRSSPAAHLMSLLQLADSKRKKVPLTQTAAMASQMNTSRLWGKKAVKRGRVGPSKGGKGARPSKKRKVDAQESNESTGKKAENRNGLVSLWSNIAAQKPKSHKTSDATTSSVHQDEDDDVMVVFQSEPQTIKPKAAIESEEEEEVMIVDTELVFHTLSQEKLITKLKSDWSAIEKVQQDIVLWQAGKKERMCCIFEPVIPCAKVVPFFECLTKKEVVVRPVDMDLPDPVDLVNSLSLEDIRNYDILGFMREKGYLRVDENDQSKLSGSSIKNDGDENNFASTSVHPNTFSSSRIDGDQDLICPSPMGDDAFDDDWIPDFCVTPPRNDWQEENDLNNSSVSPRLEHMDGDQDQKKLETKEQKADFVAVKPKFTLCPQLDELFDSDEEEQDVMEHVGHDLNRRDDNIVSLGEKKRASHNLDGCVEKKQARNFAVHSANADEEILTDKTRFKESDETPKNSHMKLSVIYGNDDSECVNTFEHVPSQECDMVQTSNRKLKYGVEHCDTDNKDAALIRPYCNDSKNSNPKLSSKWNKYLDNECLAKNQSFTKLIVEKGVSVNRKRSTKDNVSIRTGSDRLEGNLTPYGDHHTRAESFNKSVASDKCDSLITSPEYKVTTSRKTSPEIHQARSVLPKPSLHYEVNLDSLKCLRVNSDFNRIPKRESCTSPVHIDKEESECYKSFKRNHLQSPELASKGSSELPRTPEQEGLVSPTRVTKLGSNLNKTLRQEDFGSPVVMTKSSSKLNLTPKRKDVGSPIVLSKGDRITRSPSSDNNDAKEWAISPILGITKQFQLKKRNRSSGPVISTPRVYRKKLFGSSVPPKCLDIVSDKVEKVDSEEVLRNSPSFKPVDSAIETAKHLGICKLSPPKESKRLQLSNSREIKNPSAVKPNFDLLSDSILLFDDDDDEELDNIAVNDDVHHQNVPMNKLEAIQSVKSSSTRLKLKVDSDHLQNPCEINGGKKTGNTLFTATQLVGMFNKDGMKNEANDMLTSSTKSNRTGKGVVPNVIPESVPKFHVSTNENKSNTMQPCRSFVKEDNVISRTKGSKPISPGTVPVLNFNLTDLSLLDKSDDCFFVDLLDEDEGEIQEKKNPEEKWTNTSLNGGNGMTTPRKLNSQDRKFDEFCFNNSKEENSTLWKQNSSVRNDRKDTYHSANKSTIAFEQHLSPEKLPDKEHNSSWKTSVLERRNTWSVTKSSNAATWEESLSRRQMKESFYSETSKGSENINISKAGNSSTSLDNSFIIRQPKNTRNPLNDSSKLDDSNKSVDISKKTINRAVSWSSSSPKLDSRKRTKDTADSSDEDFLTLDGFSNRKILRKASEEQTPKVLVLSTGGNVTDDKLEKGKQRKKKKKKALKDPADPLVFIDNEAEVSKDQLHNSSDGEDTSGLDSYDDSFVDDVDTVHLDEEEHTLVDIQAKYLQSVRSPLKAGGKFKMPDPGTSNFPVDVFSQAVEEDDNSYEEDSFCVDDIESQEESSQDPLEVAEALLREQAKARQGKRRISSSPLTADGDSPVAVTTKKRRKRIIMPASDSEDEEEEKQNDNLQDIKAPSWVVPSVPLLDSPNKCSEITKGNMRVVNCEDQSRTTDLSDGVRSTNKRFKLALQTRRTLDRRKEGKSPMKLAPNIGDSFANSVDPPKAQNKCTEFTKQIKDPFEYPNTVHPNEILNSKNNSTVRMLNERWNTLMSPNKKLHNDVETSNQLRISSEEIPYSRPVKSGNSSRNLDSPSEFTHPFESPDKQFDKFKLNPLNNPPEVENPREELKKSTKTTWHLEKIDLEAEKHIARPSKDPRMPKNREVENMSILPNCLSKESACLDLSKEVEIKKSATDKSSLRPLLNKENTSVLNAQLKSDKSKWIDTFCKAEPVVKCGVSQSLLRDTSRTNRTSPKKMNLVDCKDRALPKKVNWESKMPHDANDRADFQPRGDVESILPITSLTQNKPNPFLTLDPDKCLELLHSQEDKETKRKDELKQYIGSGFTQEILDWDEDNFEVPCSQRRISPSNDTYEETSTNLVPDKVILPQNMQLNNIMPFRPKMQPGLNSRCNRLNTNRPGTLREWLNSKFSHNDTRITSTEFGDNSPQKLSENSNNVNEASGYIAGNLAHLKESYNLETSARVTKPTNQTVNSICSPGNKRDSFRFCSSTSGSPSPKTPEFKCSLTTQDDKMLKLTPRQCFNINKLRNSDNILQNKPSVSSPNRIKFSPDILRGRVRVSDKQNFVRSPITNLSPKVANRSPVSPFSSTDRRNSGSSCQESPEISTGRNKVTSSWRQSVRSLNEEFSAVKIPGLRGSAEFKCSLTTQDDKMLKLTPRQCFNINKLRNSDNILQNKPSVSSPNRIKVSPDILPGRVRVSDKQNFVRSPITNLSPKVANRSPVSPFSSTDRRNSGSSCQGSPEISTGRNKVTSSWRQSVRSLNEELSAVKIPGLRGCAIGNKTSMQPLGPGFNRERKNVLPVAAIHPSPLSHLFNAKGWNNTPPASGPVILASSRVLSSASEILMVLRSRHKTTVHVMSMGQVDFAVSWRAGLTRVPMADLSRLPVITSIVSSLSEAFQMPILAVEDGRPMGLVGQTMWSPGAIRNMAQLRRAGIKVVLSRGKEHTAHLLATLCRKELDRGHGIVFPSLTPIGHHELRFYELLPGVNQALALKLWLRFPTISKFIESCDTVSNTMAAVGVRRDVAVQLNRILSSVAI